MIQFTDSKDGYKSDHYFIYYQRRKKLTRTCYNAVKTLLKFRYAKIAMRYQNVI